MILEFTIDNNPSQRYRAEDFLQISTREHIYNMPFEIRIKLKQRVYHRQIKRVIGTKVHLVLVNGHELDLVVHFISHQKEHTLITFIHEDLYRLARNLVENRETVYTMELVDLISYDDNTYLHHREELGKRGLVLTVKDTLLDLEVTHMTDWEGREAKVVHDVFRKSDIHVVEEEAKILAYNHKETVSSMWGKKRHIVNFRISKEDAKGLQKKLFPHMSLICTGLNEHIKTLDKTKIGDIEYAIMGIQRVWKRGNVLTRLLIGRENN